VSKGKLPVVAVVGRPNVGKSTFFNRVVPGGDAVVDDMPGVTRDRREGKGEWNGRTFTLLDTGGLVPGTHDAMETAILTQGTAALNDADVIVLMIDAREGPTAIDEDIARALRRHAEKVVLVANKVEGPPQEHGAAEASALGLGEPWCVSAQHGRGMGDFLDELVSRFPDGGIADEEDNAIRVALLGRPNVGKSSLANRLLGRERFIVHEEPGTTRDAVDDRFKFDGTEYVLVDTAGLRRRSHVSGGVEYYSTLRTQRSLERCDVALLVIDASQEVAGQDARIAGQITEAGKSMVFVVNKWDLLEKETGTAEAFTRNLHDTFPLLAGSPVLYVSAKTGLRVTRIPALVRELWEERRQQFSTSELNRILKEASERVHPPPLPGKRLLKLYYVTQVRTGPPAFAVFVNDPQSAGEAYRQYLRNSFREALGLKRTPIWMDFRARRR